MQVIISSLENQIYQDFDNQKNGKPLSIQINKGVNFVDDKELISLKKIKLFNFHLEHSHLKIQSQKDYELSLKKDSDVNENDKKGEE